MLLDTVTECAGESCQLGCVGDTRHEVDANRMLSQLDLDLSCAREKVQQQEKLDIWELMEFGAMFLSCARNNSFLETHVCVLGLSCLGCAFVAGLQSGRR